MSPFFTSFNVVELSLFLVGLGYLWTQFKQGGNNASKDVISIYQTQVTQLKEENSDMRNDIHKLNVDLGELRGILKEKDERIKILENVDLNRNPEIESFITISTATYKELNQYMALSTKQLNTLVELLTIERQNAK